MLVSMLSMPVQPLDKSCHTMSSVWRLEPLQIADGLPSDVWLEKMKLVLYPLSAPSRPD